MSGHAFEQMPPVGRVPWAVATQRSGLLSAQARTGEALAADAKAARPRSRKGATTRARLVDSAKQVFSESGFLDARISDIAERAELSHGSFYHYFDSKEEVFREVAEAVERRLSTPMETIIRDSHSHAAPKERITAALRRHLEDYCQEAKIMGVIEQVSRYDPHLRAWREVQHARWNSEFADSIAGLQRHGLADPALDPLLTAHALGSMTTRFPEKWLVEGAVGCTLDQAVETLSRVFINALGVDRGPWSRPTAPAGNGRARRGRSSTK